MMIYALFCGMFIEKDKMKHKNLEERPANLAKKYLELYQSFGFSYI